MVIGTFKILKEDLQIVLEIHLKELRNKMGNFRTTSSKILKRSVIIMQKFCLVSKIEQGHLGDKYTKQKQI
jgi:hypothetical protein